MIWEWMARHAPGIYLALVYNCYATATGDYTIYE